MLLSPGAVGLVGPVGRALLRSPAAGSAPFLALPALAALATRHDDLSGLVTILLIGGSASAAMAFDDSASASLDACPVPSARRRNVRAALLATSLATAAVVVVVAARFADADLGPIRDRIPETVAAGALACAAAAGSIRTGRPAPGVSAAFGTVIGLVSLTGLAMATSALAWLPQLGRPDLARRWWITAAVASACALWWARDPAARGPRR